MDVRLAFCERSMATEYSQNHIRQVGPEGLLPGGGVPGAALCGMDLHKGWDLPQVPVTVEMVRALREPRTGDGKVFLCGGCADAALDMLGG